MKTTPEIKPPPKGWRRMRRGEIVRRGDKYWTPLQNSYRLPLSKTLFIGDKIGDNWGDLSDQPWIRRLKRRIVGRKP